MPKLMFIGWKLPILVSLMYCANAPMAVCFGKSGTGVPCSFAAMETAVRYPEAVDSTYPSTPVICPANATRGFLLSA